MELFFYLFLESINKIAKKQQTSDLIASSLSGGKVEKKNVLLATSIISESVTILKLLLLSTKELINCVLTIINLNTIIKLKLEQMKCQSVLSPSFKTANDDQ